jgi:alpha-glucosidase (family GH31 glycosyl hydrolase)
MKAIWMQDWVGTFAFPEGVRLLWNWQLNNQHYPDWNGMIDSWAKDGVRPMTYMNPYFANLTGHDDIRDNYFE